MFDRERFEEEKAMTIASARSDRKLIQKGLDFIIHSDKYKYGYNWTWMGLPIIQMPEDIVITQEILWTIKPDFVIEAGVAWGGSLAMYAAFLELLDKGRVFGIDVTIPEHNRHAILSCPVSHRITLIEGSSTDPEIFDRISKEIPYGAVVLLILDSNHTEEHVLNELELWSSIINVGSYIIVSDTVVELIPEQIERPRPWGPGNNPMTAVRRFLSTHPEFSFDNQFNNKAINSFNPNGYLLRIK